MDSIYHDRSIDQWVCAGGDCSTPGQVKDALSDGRQIVVGGHVLVSRPLTAEETASDYCSDPAGELRRTIAVLEERLAEHEREIQYARGWNDSRGSEGTWCIDRDGWTVHAAQTEAEAEAVLRGEVIKGLKGTEVKRHGAPRWSPAAQEAMDYLYARRK